MTDGILHYRKLAWIFSFVDRGIFCWDLSLYKWNALTSRVIEPIHSTASMMKYIVKIQEFQKKKKHFIHSANLKDFIEKSLKILFNSHE